MVAAGWWFYPVWTAETIPYEAWRLRMWFSAWV
jgi:dolichyl-phosphate-mannose--protein O-mannosyl transferase